jgi:GNAT superfamily N-acetyltransferase
VQLILRAVGELRERTGKPPIPWRPRAAPAFLEHLLATNRETFLCAWRGARLVGFAAALIRGRQWYLAFLFVDPHLQGRGIGRELLRRVWREGPRMTHGLGTFTYNQRAVGLYTSYGMLPSELITLIEGESARIRIPEPTSLEVSTDIAASDVAWINRLEGTIRGYPRAEEWRFWARSDEYRLFLFRRKGRRVGYGLLGPRDEIGPLGVLHPADLLETAAASIRAAANEGRKLVRFYCPNRNRDLYRYLHRLGFRNSEMLLFMTDRPYGDFARYVPAPLAVF